MKGAAAARVAGQAVAYAAFAAAIGWLSAAPLRTPAPDGHALVKLSFTHAAARLRECRRLDPAEVAARAPNMRVAQDCERGRTSVAVALLIDGEPVYTGEHPPTGLWDDGPSVVYETFWVPAGPHRLELRIRDSVGDAGFDHVASAQVDLRPLQNFVIDFRPQQGGIVFH